MSIREALEAAEEYFDALVKNEAVVVNSRGMREKLRAALRELDAVKPEREGLVRWVQGYIASILQIDEPSRQLRSMQADIEALNRIAAILRGERDV